ncbi:metallophosphoesterase [Thalassoglobus sp.]|uniref:metallophosphoesterase n=1 Tax=Thalassoglobus sp. TaxID=2795869 RepID=UPI003AA95907
MSKSSYHGLLMIGDPHLEGRQPGFRKDDYPNVILDKLDWSLSYARENDLLPIILGDLFDKPRDNPTWVIGKLFEILKGEILSIYGNHDVHYQPELTEHDSLSLLVKAGCLRMVSADNPWVGVVNGHPVIVSGSSYRQEIPKKFDPLSFVASKEQTPIVFWLTHHDILIPGYDEGRVKPSEIPGIDVIVNGHIHRRLETVQKGGTHWLTPGNISRRSRNDATKEHIPSVLRIDIADDDWQANHVEIPHSAFEDVFHDAVIETVPDSGSSAFVAGLSELQSRRTSTGAGLKEFLKQNLDQFEPNVADEIWKLAEEVTHE